MRLVLEMTDEERRQQGASTAEAFAHEMDMAFQLMMRKSKGYGRAWRDQGWMGNLARILSKSSRLKNMLWGDFGMRQSDSSETVEETVRDLMNLCVFFLLNRGQENPWGREREE